MDGGGAILSFVFETKTLPLSVRLVAGLSSSVAVFLCKGLVLASALAYLLAWLAVTEPSFSAKASRCVSARLRIFGG